MEIFVASKAGYGLTKLAAFDNALSNLGVRDQNLIHLSSVIPRNATVIREHVDLNDRFQGDRVYSVYAHNATDTRGVSVAAGLGWVTTKDDPSWGLFVEHIGHTEEEVEKQIHNSLTSMMRYRDNHEWSVIEHEIATATCEEEPVCVMALAVYQRVPW